MPSCTDFKVSIVVGGVKIPEYVKDDQHYVESNLTTPISYLQRTVDTVQGEREVQRSPVTPYQIMVKANQSNEDTHYFRVLVDGVKVKGLSLDPGESRLIKGFKDGSNIREFLFAMPRFALDMTDRIDEQRTSKIGCIEVQCWNATQQGIKHGMRSKKLMFQQANKKDSANVTSGQYMMATSKAGKVIEGREVYRRVDRWSLETLRSSLLINYRMGHTLQEMGLILKPFPYIPKSLITEDKNDVVHVKSEAVKLKEPQPGTSGVVMIDLTSSDKENSESDSDDNQGGANSTGKHSEDPSPQNKTCDATKTPSKESSEKKNERSIENEALETATKKGDTEASSPVKENKDDEVNGGEPSKDDQDGTPPEDGGDISENVESDNADKPKLAKVDISTTATDGKADSLSSDDNNVGNLDSPEHGDKLQSNIPGNSNDDRVDTLDAENAGQDTISDNLKGDLLNAKVSADDAEGFQPTNDHVVPSQSNIGQSDPIFDSDPNTLLPPRDSPSPHSQNDSSPTNSVSKTTDSPLKEMSPEGLNGEQSSTNTKQSNLKRKSDVDLDSERTPEKLNKT